MMKLALALAADVNVFRDCQLDAPEVFKERIVTRILVDAIRKQIDVFMSDVFPFLKLTEDGRFRMNAEYDDYVKPLVDSLAEGSTDVATFERLFDGYMNTLTPGRSSEVTEDDYKTIIEAISCVRFSISYLYTVLKAALASDSFEVVNVENEKSRGAVVVVDGLSAIPARSVHAMEGECRVQFDYFARNFLDMPGAEHVLTELFQYLKFGRCYSLSELVQVACDHVMQVKPARIKQLFMAAWKRGEKVEWKGSRFKIVPQVTRPPTMSREWRGYGRVVPSCPVEYSEYKGGGMTLEYK